MSNEKIAMLFLIAIFLLNACSLPNAELETDENVFKEKNNSALSGSSVMSEPSVDSTASENNQLIADEQVFTTFLVLYEKAKPAEILRG